MGKETLIMFLGVWVAVQSFLGFPLAWDNVIFVILGVAILCLGIISRHEALLRHRRPNATETFVENVPKSIDNEEHNEVPRS